MDAGSIEAVEKVSASRKLGRKEAREIASAAARLIVCKGKRVDEFEPAGKPTKVMLDVMLGSTGNLRAPLLVVGDTVIVGYNEGIYRDVLG